VLFWTAHFGRDVPCSRSACEDCRGGGTTVGGDCLPDTRCTYSPPLLSYMSHAPGPAGPWSSPQVVPSPAGFEGDTNLAPVILRNGSLVGLGRPPWVWRADDWRNASTYSVQRAAGGSTVEGEDPFLYADPRTPGVLHALSHAGGWDSSGGHVWSTDGGHTWSGFPSVAAYGSLIRYSDGTHASLSRRERPHLIFDKRGIAVALTNGATDHWPCTHPEVCPRDHCFTALQRINQDG